MVVRFERKIARPVPCHPNRRRLYNHTQLSPRQSLQRLAQTRPFHLRIAVVIKRGRGDLEQRVVVLRHLPVGDDLGFAFGMRGAFCAVVFVQRLQTAFVNRLEMRARNFARRRRKLRLR